MSLEMAQKVIVPQKKNYVPQFLKQRDINSYSVSSPHPFCSHGIDPHLPFINIPPPPPILLYSSCTFPVI
jgi:hypothetical protein